MLKCFFETYDFDRGLIAQHLAELNEKNRPENNDYAMFRFKM